MVHGGVSAGDEFAERLGAVLLSDGVADAETEGEAALKFRTTRGCAGAEAIDGRVECELVELTGDGEFVSADAAHDVILAEGIGEELGCLSERG